MKLSQIGIRRLLRIASVLIILGLGLEIISLCGSIPCRSCCLLSSLRRSSAWEFWSSWRRSFLSRIHRLALAVEWRNLLNHEGVDTLGILPSRKGGCRDRETQRSPCGH